VVKTDKSHNAFNCPFYLTTTETPCRICEAHNAYGLHYPRHCLNDARNGRSSN
jgi:hypothetical protein